MNERTSQIIKIILIAILEFLGINTVAGLLLGSSNMGIFLGNVTWIVTIFMAIISIVRNIRILNGTIDGEFPFWYSKYIFKWLINKLLNR